MRLLVSLLAAALAAPVASAWMAGGDRPHHADLAEEAAALLPAGWCEILLSDREAFRKGALDPDGIVDPPKGVHTFYHAWEPDDGGGGGVYRVRLSLHEATMAIRDGNASADVAYQMGFLTHFITDLAMPFHTGDGAYDSRWHEPFEQAAYDRRAEYAGPVAHAPRQVLDAEAYAENVARESAARAPRLLAALDASEGAWSDEARAVAAESRALAVRAAADMMYTAFAMADPARPAPVFDEDMPVPAEPEDLGLSAAEIQKQHPYALPVAVGLVGLVVLVAFARRKRRGST